ncbi:MAG TPA: hypothetical protein VM890_13185 [Longimicrobium sp.]|jgi:hypothetical protein|nr:hypothetical protein [Longimicrobium sp.]
MPYAPSHRGSAAPAAYHLPLGAGILLLCATAACRRGGGEDAALQGATLAARCEAAVERAAPAPPRASEWRFAPDLPIGDEDAHPLGRVMGAAWDARRGVLYVLDGSNSRVSMYDGRGRWVGAFGRSGLGPGEFEELGPGHGVRPVYNQIAIVGGSVAVMELDLLHLFDTQGRFLARLRTGEGQAGPHGVRQLAAISDSAVIFPQTGAMRLDTDDREVRTGLRLVRASLRGAALDTAEFGRLRNNLYRMPPFKGVPQSDPFIDLYRRTWDAIPSGLVAVASQFQHGVCFADRGGRVVTAWRVGEPPIAVDARERARVVDARTRAAGPVMPMTGQRWEDLYKAWPATLPPYADLALAPDSVAWGERRRPDGSRIVDLFHARTGYLGSLEAPGGHLPLTFSPGCAFVVEEQTPEQVTERNYFYGLRRWCRRPAPVSTPAGRARS